MKRGIQYLGLVFLIGLLFSVEISAQSITASFDPTEPTRMPSAEGWREKSAVGTTYRESSGNRKIDSQETHKFDISAMTANLQFKLGNVAVEAAYIQSSSEVTVDQVSEGIINLDFTIARLNAALVGNDFVSVGLGGQEFKTRDYYDPAHDDETSTQSSIIGSISVKTFDFLYLGGGYERVKELNTFRVDNAWNTVLFGASILLGEPGATRLRLEYSLASSPEEVSEAQGDKVEAIHNATDTSNYAAELFLSGLLFSLRGSEEKVYLNKAFQYNGTLYDVITLKKNEGGVLWIPESGIALGFYFATQNSTFFYEDEYSEFRINLAYIFE